MSFNVSHESYCKTAFKKNSYLSLPLYLNGIGVVNHGLAVSVSGDIVLHHIYALIAHFRRSLLLFLVLYMAPLEAHHQC